MIVLRIRRAQFNTYIKCSCGYHNVEGSKSPGGSDHYPIRVKIGVKVVQEEVKS